MKIKEDTRIFLIAIAKYLLVAAVCAVFVALSTAAIFFSGL